MSRPEIKICGVTSPEEAMLAADLGADLIGLNFYPPSPRYLEPHRAAEDFGRAIECAEHFGMCDADEMATLADKLDDIEGCVYEDGVQAKDVCEKEIQDRKDVADTLRMGAELQLRCVLVCLLC